MKQGFVIAWLQEKQRPGVVLIAMDDHLIVDLALEHEAHVSKLLEWNEDARSAEIAEEAWAGASGNPEDLVTECFSVSAREMHAMNMGICAGRAIILYPDLPNCPHGVRFEVACQQCAELTRNVFVWWRPLLYKIHPITIY